MGRVVCDFRGCSRYTRNYAPQDTPRIRRRKEIFVSWSIGRDERDRVRALLVSLMQLCFKKVIFLNAGNQQNKQEADCLTGYKLYVSLSLI